MEVGGAHQGTSHLVLIERLQMYYSGVSLLRTHLVRISGYSEQAKPVHIIYSYKIYNY